MAERALQWLGTSRSDVRAFPRRARRLVGFQLRRVQQGLDPSDWKPMSSVGSGVREIRVRAASAYRVLYVAKFAEAIYVLHAFEKRSRKTPQRDIELARQRFRDLMAWRRAEKGRMD